MPKRTDIKTILIIGSGPIVIGQGPEFDYSGTQACKALKAEGYRVVLVNSNPATIMTDPELSDRTYIEPITPAAVRKVIEAEFYGAGSDSNSGTDLPSVTSAQPNPAIGTPRDLRQASPTRIDAILPTLGGQTALNCACALFDNGTLAEFHVEMIGANREVIHRAEDRQVFKDIVEKLGLKMPRAKTVQTLDAARAFLDEIGLPAIIRPAFTLGGSGGGVAYNTEEFDEIVQRGLRMSMIGQVQIDQSVLGWKEYELEVVRDKKDNCIIVCGIENIDPMGVHTGDSVTVAPILTLTDKEYQAMRDASMAIMRAVGVETGGSNVQFAVNPNPKPGPDGKKPFEMVVVEMNPRVSRSSALASKATGFPIAKIAAKLAVGYTLDELRNDITGTTSACFEPAIDYVVTKMPRWTFEKFPEADETLTTQMKSVGEAMGIGRTFVESFQKVIRSMEVKRFGMGLDRQDAWLEWWSENGRHEGTEARRHQKEISQAGSATAAVSAALEWPIPEEKLTRKLSVPSQGRLYYVRYALKMGWTADRIHELSRIDPFFIDQIKRLVEFEDVLCAYTRLEDVPRDVLFEAKRLGYSDAQLACLYLGKISAETILAVRAHRKGLGIEPVYKLVDTCAAEFEAVTPYYYSTYERNARQLKIPTKWKGPLTTFFDEAKTEVHDNEIRVGYRPKVIILGGGPNRIGQGIEFDYCCVHASFAARELGYESVMINSNPETVSTDYDTSDLLFFEPLTLEDVLNVVELLNDAPLAAHEQIAGADAMDSKSCDRIAAALRQVGIGAAHLVGQFEDKDENDDEIGSLFTALVPDGRAALITLFDHRVNVRFDPSTTSRFKRPAVLDLVDSRLVAALRRRAAEIGVRGVVLGVDDSDDRSVAYLVRDLAGDLYRFRVRRADAEVESADVLTFSPAQSAEVLAAAGEEISPQPIGLVHGLIVQFGGQTPLNLARGLVAAGAPIIGTSVDSIDLAEDRDRFDALLTRLNLHKPPSGIARSLEQAVEIAARIGYPVLVRPSYVLGGRGMEICPDEKALRHYMTNAVDISDLEGAPVLIDRFLDDATEVDVDVVADFETAEVGIKVSGHQNIEAKKSGNAVHRHDATMPSALVCGVMEHIEQAGIHSGDSACTIPPWSLKPETVDEIKRIARELARELKVRGLMNVQMAIQQGVGENGEDQIYILEVNPRASRTVPFVGKAKHVPWARIAAKVMIGGPGNTLAELGAREVPDTGAYAVKECVFPFSKFPGVDVVLGPEMRSTGEVMGIDDNLPIAFAKSQFAAGIDLPTKGNVFISVREKDRAFITRVARMLVDLGFGVYSTGGTGGHLQSQGIPVNILQKIAAGARPNVIDLMADRKIDLVINTPTRTGWQTDEGRIRAATVRLGVPMITTTTGALAAAEAIKALKDGEGSSNGGWGVRAMQDYAEAAAGDKSRTPSVKTAPRPSRTPV